MPKFIGNFMRVGDALSLFVQMGCELKELPQPLVLADGTNLRVRYLINPETTAFVEIVDIEDDERIAIDEIRYWERRLSIDVPLGDAN